MSHQFNRRVTLLATLVDNDRSGGTVTLEFQAQSVDLANVFSAVHRLDLPERTRRLLYWELEQATDDILLVESLKSLIVPGDRS